MRRGDSHTHTCRHAGRQAGRWAAGRQTGRQADRQTVTDRQTDRHRCTDTQTHGHRDSEAHIVLSLSLSLSLCLSFSVRSCRGECVRRQASCSFCLRSVRKRKRLHGMVFVEQCRLLDVELKCSVCKGRRECNRSRAVNTSDRA